MAHTHVFRRTRLSAPSGGAPAQPSGEFAPAHSALRSTGPACPRCKGLEVSARAVDGRQRLSCASCRQRWYGPRVGRSTPASAILDEIADAVAAKGQAEELALVLKTYVWPQDFQGHLERWCALHGFRVTGICQPGGNTEKSESWLRFAWAPAASR